MWPVISVHSWGESAVIGCRLAISGAIQVKLASDLAAPAVGVFGDAAGHGEGIDRLPASYRPIRRVLAEKLVQERCAAPRHPGDEDRLLDLFVENFGVCYLCLPELQKIGQEP